MLMSFYTLWFEFVSFVGLSKPIVSFLYGLGIGRSLTSVGGLVAV